MHSKDHIFRDTMSTCLEVPCILCVTVLLTVDTGKKANLKHA
jgi:hypothetical protein